MTESEVASTPMVPEGMRHQVAVFDLDGTLTRYDTYLRYLIGYIGRRPTRVLRAWGLPLNVLLFKSRLRDNTWLKKRFLGSILGGLTDTELRPWTWSFVDRLVQSGLRQAGIDALRDHQSQGHRTILLSASPDVLVREIAIRLEFSDCICTIVERDRNGRLTGQLVGGNCHGSEKLRRMQHLFGSNRGAVRIVAYGDHRSDLPLLQWADLGVLVNPSPALIRAAAQMQLKVMKW